MMERLQKIMAQAGLCSRRTAEFWISDGRVSVNGNKALLGDRADVMHDRICVDGHPIGKAEKKVYLMLYKPRGYVSTLQDERERKTVAELTKACHARVVPVGRLDYTSEGLLLMTNDGDLTYRLTHPSHEVPKHYLVRVRGNMEHIEKLSEPMKIDGYEITPAQVQVLERNEEDALVRLSIFEGRNRQIRKMCDQAGLTVRRLKRVGIGELRLDRTLKPGAWRELTEDELEYLQATTARSTERQD